MAERDLTAGQQAALESGLVRLALFYEGEFETIGSPSSPTTLRLWSGNGSITVGADTYLGNSRLLSITPVQESTEIKAQGFSVTLQGILEADVQRALSAVRQGRPGTLSLGVLDSAGELIDGLIPLQVGKLDMDAIVADGGTATVTVTYESDMVMLEVPGERRYTDEDQKIDYPDDDGFDQVPKLQNLELNWIPVPVGTVGTPAAP